MRVVLPTDGLRVAEVVQVVQVVQRQVVLPVVLVVLAVLCGAPPMVVEAVAVTTTRPPQPMLAVPAGAETAHEVLPRQRLVRQTPAAEVAAPATTLL
jgi:hypothetical protein